MDRARDRLLLWVLLAHLPLAGLVAFLGGTASIMHAVGEMAVMPIIALAAYPQLAGRRSYRNLAAALLMGCSAVVIHLSGGRAELHFHVLVGLALLIVYLDWVPIAVAA